MENHIQTVIKKLAPDCFIKDWINSLKCHTVCLYCMSKQGGLNKKEKQLNLCNIFSVLIYNEFYFFFFLMILNRVKLDA